MEFVRAIESFNELFVFMVDFAFGVEIFKSDDGAFGEYIRTTFLDGGRIVGDDGTVVGRQAVSNEFAGTALGGFGGTVAVMD